jgi:hypothetical protein
VAFRLSEKGHRLPLSIRILDLTATGEETAATVWRPVMKTAYVSLEVRLYEDRPV